jgi:hypothetical protein
MGEFERPVRLGPSYALPLGMNACVCIRPPFRAAAHFALEWSRGRSIDSLLDDFDFVGGTPPGIELRSVITVSGFDPLPSDCGMVE